MKISVVALASLAVLTTTLFSLAHAQRAVFLVRHADSVGKSEDSRLSKSGEERAQLLARLLKDVGITAIYTSVQLTAKTADPVATTLKIKPVSIPNKDPEELLRRVQDENRDGVVLIVGTARSVPALLKTFGYSAEITIAPTEYDNLFVLVPKDTGPPTVLRLRY